MITKAEDEKLYIHNMHLITDTHFYHQNMIPYCGRPENFNELLFASLSKLDENDILIHLGDVSFGNHYKAHENFIMPLKCKKILVKGNHDYRSNNWYLNNGWDFVCYTFSDKLCGKKILFSHYPLPADRYDFNIFGHFHNNINSWNKLNPNFKQLLNEKHLLLCVEETNYKPVRLSYLVDKYKEFQMLTRLGDPMNKNGNE